MSTIRAKVIGDAGLCAMSFGHAAEHFLVHLRASGRSSATIESYETALALLGEFLAEPTPFEAVSAEVVEAAVTRISAARGSGGRPRCETTLNRFRSTYRSFFPVGV